MNRSNMTLPAHSLPLRVLFAPGHPRLAGLKCPFPDSDILFLGWGSIGGPEQWPDDPKALSAAMRKVLAGVSNVRALKKHEKVVVLGCERRNKWIDENASRWHPVQIMLDAIAMGMKAVHGDAIPFTFSGPEEQFGELDAPMIGPPTQYVERWDTWRRCLPFLSPIYGATVDHAASIVTRLALGPGLPHGVCLWVQAKDLAGQQAAVDFGLAVNEKWLKHLASLGEATEEGTVTA